MQSERRNLDRSLKTVFQTADGTEIPTSYEDEIRQSVLASFVIDFLPNLRCFHALPETDHGAAGKPLGIRPFRVSKSSNAVAHIVYIKNPIRTRRHAEPLRFDNELLTATVRV